MLQQTQVKTVIPYFKKFTLKYKDLDSLSKSSEREILKMWEGLGYYRRARNLLAAARLIVEKYNSKLPNDMEKIKKIPGVGDYTANVLLALIHEEPRIALDGNVKRVFARIINKDINDINYRDFIMLNRNKLLKSKRNSDLVESLMEFGALICKPQNPNCNICSIQNNCKYYNSNDKVSITNNKIIKKENFDIFCYINNSKQIALTKKHKITFLNSFNLPKIKERKKNSEYKDWKFLKNYKNSISNKKLDIDIYYKFANKIPAEYVWHPMEKNNDFVPSFTKKIIKQISTLF